MKKSNVLKTEHLTIYPLSDIEMENLIAEELNTDMKQAYSEMLNGCKQNPEQRIWYAIWKMHPNIALLLLSTITLFLNYDYRYKHKI